MIIQIKYKGEIIDKKDIEVTWSDCFGEHRVDSFEGFVRQYTDEQVAKEIAEENIEYEDMIIECYDCHTVINFHEDDIVNGCYVICPRCGQHLVILE